MKSASDLLAELGHLLEENGVGLSFLTPRPRGWRLANETREEIKGVLDGLHTSPTVSTNLVYGNGLFAVGRFADAALVYRDVLDRHQ